MKKPRPPADISWIKMTTIRMGSGKPRRPGFERWHDAAEGTRTVVAGLALALSGSILGEAVFGPGSTQRVLRLILAGAILAAFLAGPLLHWAGHRSYERRHRKKNPAGQVIQLPLPPSPDREP